MKNKTYNQIARKIRLLVSDGAKLGIACSGGADSMAVLHIAIKTLGKDRVHAFHVTHLNFCRPDKDVIHDQELVVQFCVDNGIDYATSTIWHQENDGNVEGSARAKRYKALTNMSRVKKCEYLATGHHADDQLETMLMRICRGAGPRGLVGIDEVVRTPENELFTVIRPALDVTHEELCEYCHDNNIAYAVDASNLDGRMSRNRIRHDIIPILKQLYPHAARNAVKAGRLNKQSHELLMRKTGEIMFRTTDSKGERPVQVEIDIDELINQPDIVVAEFLRNTFSWMTDGHYMDRISNEMTEQVVDKIGTLRGKETWKTNWPSVDITISSSVVIFRMRNLEQMPVHPTPRSRLLARWRSWIKDLASPSGRRESHESQRKARR